MGLIINKTKIKYMVVTYSAYHQLVEPRSIQRISDSRCYKVNLIAQKYYYRLIKHFKSLNYKRKCFLYKTLVLPVLTYGLENWVLSKNDKNLEQKFLKKYLVQQ